MFKKVKKAEKIKIIQPAVQSNIKRGVMSTSVFHTLRRPLSVEHANLFGAPTIRRRVSIFDRNRNF